MSMQEENGTAQSFNFENFKRYYLTQYNFLEKQFLKTSDFVTVEKDNYATFSREYHMLYLSICSEFSGLCGAYSNYKIFPQVKTYWNIVDTAKIVNANFINISNASVKTDYLYGSISMQPLLRWRENLLENKHSDWWWSDHNKVKHERAETEEGKQRVNYKRSNLNNVLHSLAALYVLCTCIYRDFEGDGCEYIIPSELFCEIKY